MKKDKDSGRFGDTGDGFLPRSDKERAKATKLKEKATEGNADIDKLAKKLAALDEEDGDGEDKKASYDYDRSV